MIDAAKVHLMTKIAVYEKQKGKKELKMHRYTMGGYLSLKLLESFLAVTVAYVLGALLYMLRYYSNIITEGLAFSYKNILLHMLLVYAAVMIINLIITFIIQKKRYTAMLEDIKEYDRNLFALKKYLDQEEELQ